MSSQKNSWKGTKSVSRNFQTFPIKWKISWRIFLMTTINFISRVFFSIIVLFSNFRSLWTIFLDWTFFPILRALWMRGKNFFCFNKTKTFWISEMWDPSLRKVPIFLFFDSQCLPLRNLIHQQSSISQTKHVSSYLVLSAAATGRPVVRIIKPHIRDDGAS